MTVDEQPNRMFWERRAEQELTLAQESHDERVVRAHYELLGLYLDRLYPDEPAMVDQAA